MREISEIVICNCFFFFSFVTTFSLQFGNPAPTIKPSCKMEGGGREFKAGFRLNVMKFFL